MLDSDSIYDFLLNSKRNLIITFDDNDRYWLRDLDFAVGFNRNGGRELKPIYAPFNKCIGVSNRIREANIKGQKNSPNVFWTTTDPIEPVMADYEAKNIKSIFDDDKQYFLYEKPYEEREKSIIREK